MLTFFSKRIWFESDSLSFKFLNFSTSVSSVYSVNKYLSTNLGSCWDELGEEPTPHLGSCPARAVRPEQASGSEPEAGAQSWSHISFPVPVKRG